MKAHVLSRWHHKVATEYKMLYQGGSQLPSQLRSIWVEGMTPPFSIFKISSLGFSRQLIIEISSRTCCRRFSWGIRVGDSWPPFFCVPAWVSLGIRNQPGSQLVQSEIKIHNSRHSSYRQPFCQLAINLPVFKQQKGGFEGEILFSS